MTKKKQKQDEACELENPQADTPESESAQQDEIVVELTQDQVAEIRGRVEELTKQSEEYKAVAQRVQADFDNYRRRNAVVKADAYAEGARDTVKALLPVLDNFDRAIASMEAGSAINEGVELVYKQLKGELKKLGLEEIEAMGLEFDPNIHNAVMQEQSDQPSGTITEVLQKGYVIKDKIIRYSMVKVSM